MKKTLALAVAICAVLGLTACGESTSIFENGEKRCDNNAVKIYNDGAWTIETTCEGTSVCNEMTHVCDVPAVTCNDGDKRCDANNVEICANNAWTIETTCEGTSVCNDKTHVCDTPVAVCEEGATACTQDGKLSSCVDHSWITSDCEADHVCPSGKTACEPIVCEESKVVCNDSENGRIACIGNAIVETPCTGDATLCEAGVCVVCMNGDKRCENNAIEHCSGNVWTTQEACADKVCDADSLSCLVIECEANWQRCNGEVVEICGAKGQYEPIAPAACAADSRCLENSDAHTATCVECKANADCKDPDASICHTDNTCVACVSGETACTPEGLLTCDANGAWPAISTACPKGHECLADATKCTPKDGHCISNDDCKDALYPVCNEETSLCECREGQTTCSIKDGQAKHATCISSIWSHDKICTGRTPFCNVEQTSCTECTDDLHCGEFYRCDLAMSKCEARFPGSTLERFQVDFDGFCQQEIAGWFFFLNPQDLSTLKAQVICGRPDQAIKDYKTIETGLTSISSNTFAFHADSKPLPDGEYNCQLLLQLDGEMAVISVNDFTFMTDLRELAPKDSGIAYTVFNSWDHVIDFEDCPTTLTASDGICTSGLSYTNAMTPLDGEAITGRSLKLAAGGTATFTAPKGIDKLELIVKPTNTNGDTTVLFFANGESLYGYSLNKIRHFRLFKENLKISGGVEVRIETDQPLVIDDLSWTNNP